MNKVFKKIKEFKKVLMFLLFTFLSLPFISLICSSYTSYGRFDMEEFLLWNYSALTGIIPYKDIFYPYGLFRFFLSSSAILGIIYFFLLPLSFIIIQHILKKINKSEILSLFFVIILILISGKIIGFESYMRQSVFLTALFINSYFIFISKKLNPLLFILGFSGGILFTLFSDQGIFVIANLIIIFLIKTVIDRKALNKDFLNDLVIGFVSIFLGALLGLIPLVFLTGFENFPKLLYFLTDIKNIGISAKTPFFPYLLTQWNMFTVIALYLSVMSLGVKHLLNKKEIDISSFLQLSIISGIVILEQKSVIRSIDQQIIPFSFLLLTVLLSDLSSYVIKFKKFVHLTAYFICTGIIVIFLITANYNQIFHNIKEISLGACYKTNLNYLNSRNKNYRNIVGYFRSVVGFNGKTFSFSLGNSGIYVLLNQKPPYYNAIAESSSLHQEKDLITYIKNNNIEYIIVNTDVNLILDGVPDFIRSKTLFKYIISNYYPDKKIGRFLILKKESGRDFFESKLLNDVNSFKDFILNPNLSQIPYSEGLFKQKDLIESKDINVKDLRSFNLSSKNLVIAVINTKDLKFASSQSLEIFTKDKKKVLISFRPCPKNIPCIIHLSSLPFFYKERIISSIKIDNKESVVRFFNLKQKNSLW